MADADRIKVITDQLEATYQNLRSAAANISGLLSVNRATCDEVKAYNLWALATYNAQRGILATLRAQGEANVPELPQYPTLFAWQGQEGEDAINIDCSGQESSLSGALSAAMRAPTDKTVFLGLDKVKVVTTDQFAYNPESSPSFSALLQTQNARMGLGSPIVVLIVVAAIVVGVSIAISALMKYLDENALQEETTRRTQIQSDAFKVYTAARLQCYQTCTASGKSIDECVQTCQGLVDKPDIKIPCIGPQCADQKWGILQWVGFTVVVGLGGIVAFRLWERKRMYGSILPRLPHLLPEHV
jgi:hypothetical protein